jgi:hypothetical protein
MTPPRSSSTSAPETTRKSWTPKTPIEVVLEQIAKQEKRVATMRDELAHEERELTKLQQARKVLEAS